MLLLFCRFVQISMIEGVMIGRGLGQEWLHGGYEEYSLSAFVWVNMREMRKIRESLGGGLFCFALQPTTSHPFILSS